MQTTHHSPIVLSYANSLLELAEEQKQAAPIGEELEQIGQILEENNTFKIFLADPSISQEERARVLGSIFGGKLTPLLWNFVGVLNLKNRLSLLSQIITAYGDLLDEKYGKIEVDITTAHHLSAEEVEDVRKRISSALKKDAVIHQYIDESIIGGMLLRVQDQLIDASVKSQLEKIKQKLKSAPRAESSN